MDSVLDWLDSKPQGTRTGVLLMSALIPLILLVGITFVAPDAAPIVGALTGMGLFLAVFGYWHTVYPPDKREENDLKASVPLKPRRGAVGVALAVWIIILLLAGQYLPAPAVGTVNVFVLLCLYWAWRATPEEAAIALAAYEAAQAEKEAAEQAAHDAETQEEDTTN